LSEVLGRLSGSGSPRCETAVFLDSGGHNGDPKAGNALVLMALGLAWGLLAVSLLQAKLTRGALLYATYANWAASCLAAAWGTNRLTPLSGVGYGAVPWKETVVQGLQVSLSVAILAGAVSVVYALRSKPAAT
jgi:hydroxylaminobenzene mutase